MPVNLAGAGDPYFPEYGNGGYDVAAYDLKIKYDPVSDRLAGIATITATAKADLTKFHLDLHGLDGVERGGRGRLQQQRIGLRRRAVAFRRHPPTGHDLGAPVVGTTASKLQKPPVSE